MARPAKILLQRCREQSFRARHHAQLLASALDLPCPALAELQRRAREVDTTNGLQAIAGEFERTLASLPPEQLSLLLPKQAPGVADEPGTPAPLPPARAPRDRDEAFLAAVKAALAELPTRFRSQLTAPEEIQAELIRRTAERLAEVDQRLAEDGLTVPGSRRQQRQHPLLALEAGLRRELTQSLRQLESTIRSRAQVERLNALTRNDRAAARARSRTQP